MTLTGYFNIEEMPNPSALYLKSLYLRNVRTFKGSYTFDLSDGMGKPASWTVILGNNNTGKTTVLRAISDLEPKMAFIATVGQNDPLLVLRPPTNLERGVHDFELWATCNYDLKILQQNHNDVTLKPIDFKTIQSKTYREISCDFFLRKDLQQKINESDYDLYEIEAPYNPVLNYGFSANKVTEGYWGFCSKNDRSGVLTPKVFGYPELENLEFFGYGPSRRISPPTLQSQPEENDATISLFRDVELINAEEWLLQADYAKKSGNKEAIVRLNQLKVLLFDSGILPDITNFRFKTDKEFKSFVEVKSKNIWVRLSQLSYGYQSVTAWLIDLAKRMFDRYPEMDNPLHGPAIVLVDEIDLHLHPEWQRKIIKYLSDLFPNTQFIVTAHSPLIVQSAENVNLIMLEKDDDTGSINVRRQFGSFQGWTVEEILRELMDMGEKTRSDRFLSLLKEFETGLLDEDYDKAKAAYDELDKILHPASSQRKLLSIQLSSLVPA